jgi:hypothetical protein
MFAPQNKERFERLRRLTPIEAVQVWLAGEFGIGDEPALISAIRKDGGVGCSDEEIIEKMGDAMDEDLDAASCLLRLASS